MSTVFRDSGSEFPGGLNGLRASLPSLDDKALVQALRDVECVSRQATSVMLDIVAEVDARGIAGREGFGTTRRLIGAVLRLSAADARVRAEQARLLGARRSVVGEILEPQSPATAVSLAEGKIGAGQLRVITEAMTLLPASAPELARAQVEADLAGYAADFDPRRLRTLAGRMLAHVDPDGIAPAEHPAATMPPRGELWLRDRRDGGLGVDGWLNAEHGAMLRSLIDQLAAPRPASEGTPDQRSLPARQADALIELADRARAGEDFPTSGGERPHLAVLVDYEALRDAVGTATLDHGQLITAAEARRLACDALVIPVVLGGDSEPLDVGRASRTVPRALRRALIARDRGCTFPGCDRPPARCDAHHLQHWVDNGPTCITNCCLLCPQHHHQVHPQGWDLRLVGSRVEFRPPAIIDPERRPLINPLRR